MFQLIAYLSLAFIAFAAYWFMIRPMLQARPAFAELYGATDSFWSSLAMKIESIKTKLLAVSLMIASGLVGIHDFLIPLATGLDWTPVTSRVPPIVWPFLTIGFNALFFWLRKLTEEEQARKLVAVETGVVSAAEVIKGDTAAAVAISDVPKAVVEAAKSEGKEP